MNKHTICGGKEFSHILAVTFLSLLACGGGSNSPSEMIKDEDVSTLTYLSLENTPAADIEVLFIGNSHSAAFGLPQMVAQLVELGTDKSANGFREAGSKFLADRSFNGDTRLAIMSRPWTHVVLQAQKYSTSGQNSYPTEAAQQWIRIVKQQTAIPVLFPEHPRANNLNEGRRVHDLHVSIASLEPACVSPVGLAWDIAIAEYPELILHATDGNHANLKGAFLTAAVFYQVITDELAQDIPASNEINIAEAEQTILKQIATRAVLVNPPCNLYP